jgi:hypothetical protein
MTRHLANWEGKAFCGKTDGIIVNDSTNNCQNCRYTHKLFVGACTDGNCRHRRFTHEIVTDRKSKNTWCMLDSERCGTKMLVRPGEDPTCDECLRVGRMRRGIFQNARKAGHVIYKRDGLYLKRDGRYLQPPLPMRYEIRECYVADSAVKGDTLVAGFCREEDRDRIFDAMLVGGYCGHIKKSWIRSIDE